MPCSVVMAPESDWARSGMVEDALAHRHHSVVEVRSWASSLSSCLFATSGTEST